MSALNIPSLFRDAQIIYKVLRTGQTYRPPALKRAMLLGGTITHVTATDTFLDLVDALADTEFIYYRRKIGNAVATQLVPVFPIVNETGGHNSVWQPMIMDMSKQLYFLGDAAAKADLCILEW